MGLSEQAFHDLMYAADQSTLRLLNGLHAMNGQLLGANPCDAAPVFTGAIIAALKFALHDTGKSTDQLRADVIALMDETLPQLALIRAADGAQAGNA